MSARSYPRKSLGAAAAALVALACAGAADAGTVGLRDECPKGCGTSTPTDLALVWQGEAGEANDVVVAPTADGGWRLEERGAGARLVGDAPGCVVALRVATCDRTKNVVLDGKDGDDRLSTDAIDEAAVGYYLEWIFGGPGDDVIDGGDHDAQGLGGLFWGEGGDDTLSGGSGAGDRIGYDDHDASVDVSLAPRPAGARNGTEGEHDVIGADMDAIFGSPADDVLHGDEGHNEIVGSWGWDAVHGAGGDDLLYGNDLSGDDGDDVLTTGADPGVVSGGAGRDEAVLWGGTPQWYVQASLDGLGNDGGVVSEDFAYGPRVPKGNLLDDVEDVQTGRIADLVIGDDGPNLLRAGGGPDVIDARGGQDSVEGDHTWDEQYDGGDFIITLDGAIDTVVCRGGIDVVIADLDDQLASDCEQRSADRVPLPDIRIPWPAVDPPPVPVELPPVELPPLGLDNPLTTATADPSDSCRIVAAGARRLGSRGADCLVGGRGSDWIDGGAGPDRLLGEGGRDRLVGGKGNDWIDGGAGGDNADGGRGDDLVLGGIGADKLLGAAGDDVVVAADGRRDKVDCGKGRDTAVVDRFDRLVGCERAVRTKARPQ